jgi:hypothetical protein
MRPRDRTPDGRRPRGAAGGAAALVAGLAVLATTLGPLAPGAHALDLPPRSVAGPVSPLPAPDLTLRLPDLTVDVVVVRTAGGADPAPVARGGALDVVAMHTNAGSGDAPLSTTRFALVREPAPRPPAGAPRGDAGAGGLSAALGEVTVPALAAGRADFPFLEGGSWRFTVPADVRSGLYRVRACADAPGAVREGREDNNCRLSAERLRIGG